MIFPWARVLISAGAHGLRRIPGQSVNLAHLIWRTPRAPAPLQGAPPVVFRAGLWVLGGNNKSGVIPDGVSRSGTPNREVLWGPRSALRFGGDDRFENEQNTSKRFGAHSGHPTAVSIVRATSGSSSVRFLRKRIAPRRSKSAHLTTQMSRQS
jgi:hypothetical protein